MEWRQFVISLEAIEPARVEEVLCRHGAHSVTLSGAEDEPIFEPAPGTTPLWSDTRMSALFSADADFSLLRADLRQTLAIDTLPENSVERVPDRAWEREWLDRFKPMRFGERLWVSPQGFDVDADKGIVVRLDPGLAFGTGTHATTALCLEWLDSREMRGKTLLDFGCGSGILALAALKLGAHRVTAVDYDLQAITATRQNALVNEVEDRLVTATTLDGLEVQFDFIVANILAATLVIEADQLCRQLKPGGEVALSGILTEQLAEVSAAYQDCIEFTTPAYRDEWACLSGTKV